jgi:hypothetical protein
MALPTIDTVLMLHDQAMADEAGVALWTTTEEVEGFYNLGDDKAVFHRLIVAPQLPDDLSREVGSDEFIPLSESDAVGIKEQAHVSYSGTHKQDVVSTYARGVVPSTRADDLIVITDYEIIPPTDWRYLIWDRTPEGWVISLAPLDPAYWGIGDPDRVATLKRRARAALMGVTGIALGFDRCDNEKCYLFANVDSVNRLDLMIYVGEEHEQRPIDEAVGYSTVIDDPTVAQTLGVAEDLEIESGWTA